MVQKNVSVISSEEFSKIKPPSPKAANQQVPPPPPPLLQAPADDANLSRSLPADVSDMGGGDMLLACGSAGEPVVAGDGVCAVWLGCSSPLFWAVVSIVHNTEDRLGNMLVLSVNCYALCLFLSVRIHD